VTYAIGIDIGGTRTKCVAADAAGRVLLREVYATGDAAQDWKRHVPAFAELAVKRLGTPVGVGLACPGIVEPGGKTVFWMIGRMDSVQGFDFGSLVPGLPCALANDAQAALLGERWVGAARGCENVMLLTLGTGVGGAAVVDGRLLRGHLGRAGHLGHISLDPNGAGDICNTPGSLESAIGDATVAERSGGRFADTRALVEAVRRGDRLATEVWDRSVRALAAGVAGLINTLDPEKLIIGGGIALAGEELFGRLERELERMEWRPHGRRVAVVAAELGEDAGALGAAWLGMQRAAGLA
jgi:glucokinase